MVFIDEEKYRDCIGIYKILNTVNGNYYIGKTAQSFQRRYWHHAWKLHHNEHDNRHLQSAWNKYGEDVFEFDVVCCAGDSDDLNELEKLYIQDAKDKGLSYNISAGGDGKSGVSMSEKAKRIVGEKNRLNNLGKKHSLETKKKMSRARTGKPYTVYRTTTKLNDELAFEAKRLLISVLSIREVSNKLNVDYKLINNIYSNNTWKHIHVDGWEQFFCSIKRKKRSISA